MTHDWFVIRSGKEQGPLTAQQLKEMAAQGKLSPDDLVRRNDMKTAFKASSIKGLFATATPAPTKSPPLSTGTSPSAATQKKGGLSKKTLITLSVVGGTCIFLCCGSCGIMGFIGHRMGEAFKKEMADADALWQSGKKSEAVAVYRKEKDDAFLEGNDRAVVYGRLIDYEYETGDAAGGKALIDEADKKGVTPAVNHADAKAVVAAMQAEKARIEAEQAEKKRLAEAKKKEEERKASLGPVDKLKEAKWDDVVPAGALYSEFNGNEVAAAEKYNGKTIMVEGGVDSVEKGGAFSSDKIILVGRAGSQAVRCSVSGGSADELRKLQPCSWVRVQGRCDSKAPSGIVEMSGCIFVLVSR